MDWHLEPTGEVGETVKKWLEICEGRIKDELTKPIYYGVCEVCDLRVGPAPGLIVMMEMQEHAFIYDHHAYTLNKGNDEDQRDPVQ